MKTYLAFTLGPIYKTLLKARKTRELWISSYMFSYLMRLLLLEIREKQIGKILAPDINLIADYMTFHGAGVFNDRCMIELFEGKSFSNDDYIKLRDKIIQVFSGTFSTNPTLFFEMLKEYLQFYGIVGSFDLEKLKYEKDPKDRSVIFRLNKMMDDLERQSVYQSKDNRIVELVFEDVTEFYTLGFKKDNTDIRVFKDIKKITKTGAQVTIPEIMSFPSVVEICGRQLLTSSKEEFNEFDQIIRKGLSYLVSEVRTRLEEPEDASILNLLKERFESRFKTAHKYICVVNADGDSMGQCLGKIGNNWDSLDKFSKNLSAFARKSSGIIHEYGGHPVYIGGDDLFFLAPVLSTVNGNDQSIFDLIKRLDLCFREIWDNNKIEDVDVQTSMSYGVSITYYKYPLAEAVSLSHELLGDAKKAHGKNAIATQVMHHSGQYSKTVFEKKAGGSFDDFLSLLKDFPAKDTFISSVHERIRSDKTLIETIGLDDPIDFGGYFDNEYDIVNMRDTVKKNFIENSTKIFESMFETQKTVRKEKEKELKKKGKTDFSELPNIEDEALAQLDTIYRLLNFLIRTDND